VPAPVGSTGADADDADGVADSPGAPEERRSPATPSSVGAVGWACCPGREDDHDGKAFWSLKAGRLLSASAADATGAVGSAPVAGVACDADVPPRRAGQSREAGAVTAGSVGTEGLVGATGLVDGVGPVGGAALAAAAGGSTVAVGPVRAAGSRRPAGAAVAGTSTGADGPGSAASREEASSAVRVGPDLIEAADVARATWRSPCRTRDGAPPRVATGPVSTEVHPSPPERRASHGRASNPSATTMSRPPTSVPGINHGVETSRGQASSSVGGAPLGLATKTLQRPGSSDDQVNVTRPVPLTCSIHMSDPVGSASPGSLTASASSVVSTASTSSASGVGLGEAVGAAVSTARRCQPDRPVTNACGSSPTHPVTSESRPTTITSGALVSEV